MLRQKLGITSLEEKFDENDQEEHREQDNDEDQQSQCNLGSETEKHGRLLRFMIYTLYVRDLGILITYTRGLKDLEPKLIIFLALCCAILAVVGVLLILSHKHESRQQYKFISWAILLIKNSILAFNFGFQLHLQNQQWMDLSYSIHIIHIFVFGLVNLLLIPDSKSLRLILFVSISLLLWATIYNLDISRMDSDYIQKDIVRWVTLFVSQLLYYGGICFLMMTARAQLIETINTNKEHTKQLAIVLDNLQESIIILNDK